MIHRGPVPRIGRWVRALAGPCSQRTVRPQKHSYLAYLCAAVSTQTIGPCFCCKDLHPTAVGARKVEAYDGPGNAWAIEYIEP